MRKFLKVLIVSAFLINNTSFSQLITSDIDNFWAAFTNLKNCKTEDDSVRCLDQIMFSNASYGFAKLIRKFSFTPTDYYLSIKEYPKFYNSIKKNTFVSKSIEKDYNKFIVEVRKYYTDYNPLKVFFVISPLKCGGTQTDSAIIVGTEIITSTNKIDLSEFKGNLLGKILAFDTNVKERLIFTIAHETVHNLQKNADFDNYELLNRSLNEGSADFVAKMFTGTIANHVLYDYGIDHEKELWVKFTNDLKAGANTDDWMYNYDRVENEMPADLGYFIGYRIAEAYYNNCTDKRQAIFDIIELKNPGEFLKKSKYNGNQ